MLISHESPLALLKESFEYNDYDYFLYHLIAKYPEYENHIKESKNRHRISILDNSAYELYNHSTGESDYDIKEFVRCIKDYIPTYYILPDYFNDGEKTIQLAKNFLKKYKIKNSTPLGVVQGKNLKEYIECYNFMKENTEIIGINFMQGLYTETLLDEKNVLTKEEKLAEGRILFINNLERKNVIDKNKKHHLLGTMYPQDISYFKYKNYIKSVDTSSPVLHGMLDIKYKKLSNNLYGLNDKAKVKMHNIMENTISKEQRKTIEFNIQKFRENLK